MKYYGKLYGEQRGQRTRYWDTGKTGKDWEDIERERDEAREETMRVRDFMDVGFSKAKDELDDAAQTLADIMRDEVNAQDAAEKWLRAYAPHHLFPENVKGHASPENAPKIDHTASLASHVPACYPSSFLEGAESGNQSGGFIPTNEDGTIRFGTEGDGDVGSSCACDSDARNIVDVDPSLHRATYDVPVSISDVNELWEWHEIGMIMGMMEDRGCRELMLHWSDLFGGDQSRFVEFMEYLQRGSSFMGRLSIRITPRGPWIDISLDNADVRRDDGKGHPL
jgi:hypothetical protein